jgi:hypothetical protein
METIEDREVWVCRVTVTKEGRIDSSHVVSLGRTEGEDENVFPDGCRLL